LAPITNNGTLAYNRSNAISVSNLISGSGTFVHIGTGTTTLTASNTYTGGTSVQSGTLITSTNFSNGTLSITAATARVAQHAINNDPDTATIVPALSISAGTLDLNNNAMIVDYTGASPLLAIRAQLASGYASGAWNGIGINSTTAANDVTYETALGYAEASSLGVGDFAGHPLVDPTEILIRYTLYGDANLDSIVNALDFNALASNFGLPGANLWTQADFNYDGQVNSLDFDAIAMNFSSALPGSLPSGLVTSVTMSVVPEPITGFILASALFARRFRFRRTVSQREIH
jgi:autotransporter-associated beta strand protein